MVIGDINIDLLKNSSSISEYKNLVQMNGFQFQNKINIQNATRTANNSASVLDHVITNKNIQCDINLEDHTISDHKIIYSEVSKVVYKNSKQMITKTFLDINKWKQKVEEKVNENKIKIIVKRA